MKRVTEKKIKVLGAKAPVAETTEVRKDDTFVLVEVSKLSINDEFMKYSPRTDSEHSLKNLIIKAISQGGKDFYRPKYEPLHLMRMETFVMYLARNWLWERLASSGRLKA